MEEKIYSTYLYVSVSIMNFPLGWWDESMGRMHNALLDVGCIS